jgi:DNA-binding transcriptional MocR family regulator
VRSNLALLTAQLAGLPAAALLPIEGGWSAVIRFPRTHSDEEIAHALLDRGVAVHPGYFFDFAIEGAIVISLLTRPDVFSEGVSRILALGG